MPFGYKILALFACGMNQRDIVEQVKSLYDVEVLPELASKVSEKIMPDVNEWKNRVLESGSLCFHGCHPLRSRVHLRGFE